MILQFVKLTFNVKALENNLLYVAKLRSKERLNTQTKYKCRLDRQSSDFWKYQLAKQV